MDSLSWKCTIIFCYAIHYYICMILYVHNYLTLTIGTPLKPMAGVLPGQQIELTVNNFTLPMKCLSHYMNFDYKWEKKNSKLPLKSSGYQFTSTKRFRRVSLYYE